MNGSPATVLARLREEFPDSSGRRLRTWLVTGRVRVSGQIVRDPRTLVAPSDPVTLGPAPPPALSPMLRLVHEDAAILVVEKPSGLLTIGTEHERERTVYRLVWAYLRGARPPGRPFIVHRLDRETSGLLVLAKTPEAQERLQAQFATGSAERWYVALVEGLIARDEGTLRDVLVEERSLRVRPGDPRRRGGRARIAVTHYRVLERRADTTCVALRLGTGRRHQIRVQLAKLGHPVLGDPRHGARRDPLHRLALHATWLAFRHPGTGARTELASLPPSTFGVGGRSLASARAPASRAPMDLERATAPPGPRAPHAGAARGRVAPRPGRVPRAGPRRGGGGPPAPPPGDRGTPAGPRRSPR